MSSLGRFSSFNPATACTHQIKITTITCYSTATLLTRGFLAANRLSLSRCSLSSLYTCGFILSWLKCFVISRSRAVGTGWSALLQLNSSQTEEGPRRWYGSKGSDCVGRRPIQHSLWLGINGFRQRIDSATSWMSKSSVSGRSEPLRSARQRW